MHLKTNSKLRLNVFAYVQSKRACSPLHIVVRILGRGVAQKPKLIAHFSTNRAQFIGIIFGTKFEIKATVPLPIPKTFAYIFRGSEAQKVKLAAYFSANATQFIDTIFETKKIFEMGRDSEMNLEISRLFTE